MDRTSQLHRAVGALALMGLLAACGGGGKADGEGARQVLKVMTHDSWDVSPDLLKGFELANNVDVQVLNAGDGGAMLNRAILAKGNPIADVLYGVDNTFLGRALEAAIFVAYAPDGLERVPPAPRPPSSARS